jgi:hypothetical protein
MVATGHRTHYDEKFRTAFAGTLGEEQLESAPTLAGFVRPGRAYLTELRAKLRPREMERDVVFAQAATDDEYREKVTDYGALVIERPTVPVALWVAWFGIIAVLSLALGVLIGRRLRPRASRADKS